jgi:hypothetical protein
MRNTPAVEEINTLFSPGTARYLEDGSIVKLPFVGVFDAHSAAYNDEHPPILFNKLTGGQAVARAIFNAFNSSGSDVPLREVVLRANHAIAMIQEQKGISINLTSELAGATFVFAKIGEREVEVIQGGDCFALWLTSSGNLGITPSQNYRWEKILRDKIAKLMRQCRGDRKRMWKRFYPFLCGQRQKHNNKDFAILNGQPGVEGKWNEFKIPVSELQLLICFTDGLVPFSLTKRSENLAQIVIEQYGLGGLQEMLNWTRMAERDLAAESHEDFGEATALAVSFK